MTCIRNEPRANLINMLTYYH